MTQRFRVFHYIEVDDDVDSGDLHFVATEAMRQRFHVYDESATVESTDVSPSAVGVNVNVIVREVRRHEVD